MDVTEKEHLSEEIRRREAYLSEAQRLSHTGSFGWRVSTGEIFFSEETFQIFQVDRTTKPTLELALQRVHPEDATLLKQIFERASQEGKDLDHEYRLVMPDGSLKYVRVAARACGDGSGSIEFVGAVMDVTEQRQARAALEMAVDEVKKSQDRLRLVIDTIPGMVWSARPDGSIDFVNPPWVEYHAFSLADPGSGGIRDLIHPEDLDESVNKWRAALATGEPYEMELRKRRADGDYRWFMTRAVPLRDELGNIVRWYGTSTEIEDRKRAEMLLAGEKRLLEMIARGDSRTLVLEASCRLVEELASGSLASILLLDPTANRLRHGAAPSLPMNYAEAIDGLVIGPYAGSCGAAAYRAEPVIVSDIATDPLWTDYRDLAVAHGLRACWSRPILSSEGRVLGTFATYYREPRSPTPQERNVIEQITQLVSIAFERERAEEVLREQARLLDLTHDTVFVRDMSHVIDYWNRGAEDLYGWKREEACGKVSHQLMQTAFPGPLDEINAELLRTGHWEGELVNQKRDGTRIVVASSWSLRRDKQGRPAAILETNKDISERKRAEAELRESEEQWKNVFDNNPTMYFIIDAAGTVLLVNPFGAEQLGYQVDELVGQPVLSVFHEPDREPLQKNVAGCLEQLGSSRSWEARKVRKDGKVLWVRETAKAVSRVNGPIVLIACEDITEQKRAEEALRQAQADLAHVSRVTTMGELTASLAHEVNQPIAAAVTNANACLRWLAGDIPNLEEARAAATRIVKDGTRAAEIISRTRLLFKKGTPQQELVDVNEVIREMIVLLRNETTRYSIAVRTELAADLPRVMGDRVQLQQVIMNLIMNSIDAMKEVEGTRELAINSQRAKDEQLLVSVSDTGVGLPPQQADHIFNAFFTTKLHGTGMGLSISRSIVESHGGRLWAADNPPRGASLSLTLPAAVADLPGRTSRRGAA
jgi:PAS domain S-box-containing protein